MHSILVFVLANVSLPHQHAPSRYMIGFQISVRNLLLPHPDGCNNNRLWTMRTSVQFGPKAYGGMENLTPEVLKKLKSVIPRTSMLVVQLIILSIYMNTLYVAENHPVPNTPTAGSLKAYRWSFTRPISLLLELNIHALFLSIIEFLIFVLLILSPFTARLIHKFKRQRFSLWAASVSTIMA